VPPNRNRDVDPAVEAREADDAVLGALRRTQSCGALGLGGGAKRKAAGKRGVRKVPSKSSLRYLSEEGLCGD